jgi:transcriptional regulator with XRE-family HTH domain
MSPPHSILSDLRRIRQASRISQDAIGAAIGVTANNFSRYELGVYHPRIDRIASWAEALGYELVLRPKTELP